MLCESSWKSSTNVVMHDGEKAIKLKKKRESKSKDKDLFASTRVSHEKRCNNSIRRHISGFLP